MTVAHVLVTGAAGYLGGRLVPVLLQTGHEIRCLARTPGKLDDEAWRDDVEVVAGDVTDPTSLDRALAGIDAAYYLVHSIGGGVSWASQDRRAAEVFRDAAARAKLDQVIYLGGLGDERTDLSEHLASRHEVGDILRSGPVPIIELRAAVIIGSGSASFEMLRHLVEKLPVMVTPRWVHSRCQPIAVRDVLACLVGVLGHAEANGRMFEIGGPDVLTYADMMRIYSEVAGLPKRLILPVPVLSPRLSSLWIGLVTPVPPSLGRPLIDSLVHDVVVRESSIGEIVPAPETPFREAVELALRRVHDLDVRTAWTDAERRASPADPQPTDPSWAGGTILEDRRVVVTAAPPEAVFRAVSGIGGERGWYSASWLWTLRGALDLLVGGTGPRRGRRHPDRLRLGDVVDAWRVDRLETGRLLRLRTEMRMPGCAWLEWQVYPERQGSRLEQRARFAPRGLLGRAYWYALAPVHAVMFRRMAHRLAAAAERDHAATLPHPNRLRPATRPRS